MRAFFGAGCHSDSAEKPSPEPPPGPQSLGFAFSITEGENPHQKVVPVKERLWEKLGMVSGKRCPSNDNEKKDIPAETCHREASSARSREHLPFTQQRPGDTASHSIIQLSCEGGRTTIYVLQMRKLRPPKGRRLV